MTFEKHEHAIQAAKKVLNDTIYAAADDLHHNLTDGKNRKQRRAEASRRKK